MKKIIASLALAAATTIPAIAAEVPNYSQLAAASKYNLVLEPGATYEPSFVVGDKYTWEELMLVLIDFNIQRGHTERANYLSIALADKSYYFFSI